MSNKVMINCKEASTICDKVQYHEATLIDRIKLRMHLFLCKKCGLYSEQNKMMSKIFKTHLIKNNHHHEIKLPEQAKEELRAKLEHQMN